MLHILKLLTTAFFVLSSINVYAQDLISPGASYAFQKGLEHSSAPTDWNKDGAAVSSWTIKNAPLWYADGTAGVGTELDDMLGTYTSFYLRKDFLVSSLDDVEKLLFEVNYDDGFVIYINGKEVLERNAPTGRYYNGVATTYHESGTFETIGVDIDDANIVGGNNVLAVQVFNYTLSSSDVYFDMALTTQKAMPRLADSLKVRFCHPSGFYNRAFKTSLYPSSGQYSISYTLDGSDPRYSTTSQVCTSSDSILIDPDLTAGRPLTPGVVLRACLYNDTALAPKAHTRTYLFAEKVKSQTNPGGGFPSSNVNGQKLYYGMSADILSDARYRDKIEDALLDIPSLSIVTDAAHLFDSGTGIYVNAGNDGRDWERPCSFELLNPDGSKGFQVEAGIRIRGGWSRADRFPKHSFRLFFREEYGDAKLKYPLFGDEGAVQFDKMDLRTSQNYSWTIGDSRNTFLREVFSRDLQGDMGQPYTRSRFYHLYINGLYWGLYQTQERAEANFAASYMGGDKSDYDVIKATRAGSTFSVQATDGNMEAWQEVWDALAGSMSSNYRYYKLIGCDVNGVPDPTIEKLIDQDNLIDFMMTIFYTGNFDSPVTKFRKNNDVNNFYGIFNRENPFEGFQFFAHDNEHSLFYEAAKPGLGIQENRVNLHTRTDEYKMIIEEFSKFNPQWLHGRLTNNKEYRVAFADRAYQLFNNKGILTEGASWQRFNTRMQTISDAIVAESAKWGGVAHSPAYNKYDDWKPLCDRLLMDYFYERVDIVISQLLEAGLYPTLDFPEFWVGGELFTSDRLEYEDNEELTIVVPSGASMVYTLDGSDPRAVGGALSSSASVANATLSLAFDDAVCLKARLYNGQDWSALRTLYTIHTLVNWDYLKVTELHYHPLDSIRGADTLASDNYEFIELKNTHADRSINIGGLRFVDGVDYQFPDNYILAPQQFFVLASNDYRFFQRYGCLPSGDYQKHFSNGGESVKLLLPNDSLFFEMAYKDQEPWAPEADGLGYSLVAYESNPVSYSPDLPVYWWYSAECNGSPYADDIASKNNNPASTAVPKPVCTRLRVFPNPSQGQVCVSLIGIEPDALLQVSIYNVSQQLLYTGQCVNNARLDLSSLVSASGVYLLNIEYKELHFLKKLVLY